VLCSIILSSPLFCFPNSIKSRPFFFVSRNLSLQGCHFEWFSIENCIEKCNKVMRLIEFSIQISLFSKAKFTCLPRNAGRLELTCIQFKLFKLTTHDYSLFIIRYSVFIIIYWLFFIRYSIFSIHLSPLIAPLKFELSILKF
jgi:hypothetical protein